MSGTSVDAVDAAAFNVHETNEVLELRLIKGISFPIPANVKASIFELFEDPAGSLKNMALLNMRMGYLFADAVKELLSKSSLTSDDIAVIGSHGQTVYHLADREVYCGMPLRGSVQIGEGSVIAQQTGILTVSDFRVADMASGGCGAPLVPVLDRILARSSGPETAFQNIGGIGNVTYIETMDADPLAFDTGPGNMIIDYLVSVYTGGEYSFDLDGQFGKTGKVREDVLIRWMNHKYLKVLPPKTTGREEFGSEFFSSHVENLRIDTDLIRTAQEYTIRTITDAYRKFLPNLPRKVIVTGGGAFNPIIMEGLRESLPGCQVITGDEAGISSEFKEAAAFALMGYFNIIGRSNNVPSATGAYRPVVMGKRSIP